MSDLNLFLWADTTDVGVGDHTWVTTYAVNPGQPDPARGDYWYCWGGTRTKFRALGGGTGGSEFARLIASPNDASANAGIRYLVDGVCHQIANRLLRFCVDSQGEPLTASGARGYRLMKLVFGVYGGKGTNNRQAFEQLVIEYCNSKGIAYRQSEE